MQHNHEAKRLIQAIKHYLNTHDIEFICDDNNRFFYGYREEENNYASTGCLYCPSDSVINCFAFFDWEIPADRLAAVAEFLLRVNNCLRHGSFQLNYDNNRVQVFTYWHKDHDSEEIPGDDVLSNMVIYSNVIMNQFLPELMEVLEGHLTPELAIKANIERLRIQNSLSN